MCSVMTDPAQGLSTELESLVQKALERVTHLSDDNRDLLFYYISNEPVESTAKVFGINARQVHLRTKTQVDSFRFPDSLSQDEKKSVIKMALDIFDRQSHSNARV